jgi:hypothetical protein
MRSGKTSFEETRADPETTARRLWAASVMRVPRGAGAPTRLVDQPTVGLRWARRGQAP